MRSEKEMMDLIINTVLYDERIRAAYLCGSRVNPNVEKDIFQDYDVQYVVRETQSFRDDRAWIDRFGQRLYMQYPEDSVYFPSDVERNYGWLMQFADGNRLDLHVGTLECILDDLANDNDGMYAILVDKDDCLPKLSQVSDEAFWIKKPSEVQFLGTCNEFWWCMNNVAKGLWRGEILYALDMLNFYVRPMLTHLLEFKIGMETHYSLCVGKSAKYMQKWLSPELWDSYLQTYSVAEINEIWKSVFIMCDLVDEVALEVSGKLGFHYDCIEAKNSRAHLQHVRFNLSDEGLEDSIYDSYAMRKFMGLNFFDEQGSDATTLLKFRRIIEKHKLGQKIFEMIQAELEKYGRIMHGGTIVDATIIEAPVSTKNKTHSRDPEMHQAKKGNEWHFGGKVHIGVDAGTGTVHSIEFTAANVNDVTQTHNLVRSDDDVVHGDSGYTGIEKREEITGDEHLSEVEFRIAKRRGKVEDMEKNECRWLDRRDEYLNAKVRSKVEFAFQLLKCKFGYRKVAYRGLAKNLNRLYMIFSSVNLYMMARSGGMNRSMMSRSSLA